MRFVFVVSIFHTHLRQGPALSSKIGDSGFLAAELLEIMHVSYTLCIVFFMYQYVLLRISMYILLHNGFYSVR